MVLRNAVTNGKYDSYEYEAAAIFLFFIEVSIAICTCAAPAREVRRSGAAAWIFTCVSCHTGAYS
jgi:hypothetical protein